MRYKAVDHFMDKIRLHILLTTCYFMVGILLYNRNPDAIFTVLLVSFLSVCAYAWRMVGMYEDMENLNRLVGSLWGTEHKIINRTPHELDVHGVTPPKNGWKQQSYYVVNVSFSNNNPIHRAIFYTGFLNDDGQPNGYNEIGFYEDFKAISDVYYMGVVRIIDVNE